MEGDATPEEGMESMVTEGTDESLQPQTESITKSEAVCTPDVSEDSSASSPISGCGEEVKAVAEKTNEGFKVLTVAPARPMTTSASEVVSEEIETKGDEVVKNVDEDLKFKVPTLSLARPALSRMRTKPEASSSEEKTAEERESGEAPSPLPPTPSLPYNEPIWSSVPAQQYSLSVIKHGTIVQEVQLSDKPFHVFGRLPSCDVQLEHPSISRYHAVLQYRPPETDKDGSRGTGGDSSPSSEYNPISSVSVNPREEGFYVYDLGSTHGTQVNKSKIQPRCFYRLRLGQMVRFGGSSRIFLLEVSFASCAPS